MPGAVVAIARQGKLVYFKAFGFADKAKGVAMTTDTLFQLASMTKPMAAVGALTLTEQGRPPLQGKLADHFPAFASMQVGSPGEYSWNGANGTGFFVDPKEQLVVAYGTAAPGEIRKYFREQVQDLVYGAMTR